MLIRPAVVADAATVAALSDTLGYATSTEVMAERLARLGARSDHLVLVAEVDGGVGGWIHVCDWDLLETGRRAEIVGLVVAQRCRRGGVGRRLVDAVERWATERGLERITVRSNVVRAESHPFYERLGYVRAKTQHAYRKDLR